MNTEIELFKNKGRYYFTHEDFLSNKRNRNIMNIPKEHRNIRPNVEATMKESKTGPQMGKQKSGTCSKQASLPLMWELQ